MESSVGRKIGAFIGYIMSLQITDLFVTLVRMSAIANLSLFQDASFPKIMKIIIDGICSMSRHLLQRLEPTRGVTHWMMSEKELSHRTETCGLG